MKLQVSTDKGAAIVELNGDLTFFDIGGFKDEVNLLIDKEDMVIIDGSNLGGLDSTGLGALYHCVLRCKEKGVKLAACNFSDDMFKLLRTIQLDKLLPTHDSREEALTALGAK